ncbi:MAG: B12-binding domain-containing radical SAM protein [Actinobacteria bacterium]|nr:B12-binding domain-containing radical SAM protein [Actinomycetota bacterium]
MRVLLIAPPMPFSGRVPIAPPILEYLGALTVRAMPDAELRLLDANVTSFDLASAEADLVGISAMTATATWVYATANALRARGLRVVLGGIHPTALPREASQHADAVVVGEAESVWAQVLADAAAGTLERFYHGERLPLDGLPQPLFGALDGPYRFRAIITTRGCPYHCTFCSVRRFFGDTVRFRPIDEVVAEIAKVPGSLYFNADDNIWGADTDRSIALFNRLASEAKKPWYGFGDLKSVQGERGDELIRAAKRSGLFSVWAGWEADSQQLGAYHASAKQGRDREEAVKRIKAVGVDVTLFVVLGGRNESFEDFERAVELADRLDVGVHPALLTPFPGTELWAEYEPFLLPGLGWDRFTGVSAVFTHPDPRMTPEARERAYYTTSLDLLSLPRILGHAARIPAAGFPTTHFLSIMKALPVRRAMRKAYAEWESARVGAAEGAGGE